MAETNQLLINYYKKEEMKKVKKMMEEKLEVGEILKSVNMEWINKEEVAKYFNDIPNKKIKEYIINILESTKNVWGTAYG